MGQIDPVALAQAALYRIAERFSISLVDQFDQVAQPLALSHVQTAAQHQLGSAVGIIDAAVQIEPGSDIEQVAAVRELIGPDTPFQVDANTAYRRTDGAHLRRLDEYDLLLIEQPLPENDIIGHARLADEIATPICLDESLISAAAITRNAAARPCPEWPISARIPRR